MKKVFILFFVFAYMSCYLGCAAETQEIIVAYHELDKSTNDFPLKVMTMDSVKYYFAGEMYRFLGDTLDGITNVNGESRRIRLANCQCQNPDSSEG